MPRYHVSLYGDACIPGLVRSGGRGVCSAQELRRDATPVGRPVTTRTWHYVRGSMLDPQGSHDTSMPTARLLEMVATVVTIHTLRQALSKSDDTAVVSGRRAAPRTE